MKSLAIDSHRLVLHLEQHGFTKTQAEALLEAAEFIDMSRLTTKQDLSEFRAELSKLFTTQTLVIIAAMAALAAAL